MCAVLLVLYLLVCPAYALDVNDAEAFLEDAAPPAVRVKMSEAVKKDSNASSWLVVHEDFVYSLCAVEVRRDKSQSMQSVLMTTAIHQAAMKASAGLAMYLDGGRLNPTLYENREAFDYVLRSHYEAKAKFRTASKIINSTAFGLVWCEKVNAPLSDEEFNERYCDTLYKWEGY